MGGEVDAGGLKNAMAHVFRLRGKSRLSRAELTFALAYELKWLTPEECGEAIGFALREGLLKEEGGKLVPAFNVKDVQVPRDFRLSLAPKSLLDKIVDLLVSTGLSREAALDMVAKKQEQFGGLVVPEVAALAIAKERKLNIDAYLDEAYAMLTLLGG
jgi:hypothetical protein